MSLRDKILAAKDKKSERLEVPEWDCVGDDAVYVRTLSARERDAFEDSLSIQKGKKRERNMANFRARLLALCLVDAVGKLIFEPADVEALGDKSAPAMQQCLRVAMRLNSFDDDEVEDLTKNS